MHNASEVSRFEISQGKMMLDKGKQRKLRVGIFIFCIPRKKRFLSTSFWYEIHFMPVFFNYRSIELQLIYNLRGQK